jgi:trimethylamine--corrinoid protein Co-methyltransferase
MIHDLGYMGSGMTSSMELMVLTDEIAAMVRRVIGGVAVSPVTKAMEVIRKVGPGGNFLTEDHTLDNFKDHLHFSDLLSRYDFDNWKLAGSKEFGKRAGEKIKGILENHQVDELPAERIRAVKEVLQRRHSK